ncbi:Ribosomal protein S14p/S29e [Streptomyces sp. TLI_053]|nr:Ribosomal protein S14p/S29e [Streptomyces sp. TLI_053]
MAELGKIVRINLRAMAHAGRLPGARRSGR